MGLAISWLFPNLYFTPSTATIHIGVDDKIIFGKSGLVSKWNGTGLFEFHFSNFKSTSAKQFDDLDLVLIDKPLLYHDFFSRFLPYTPNSIALPNLEVLQQWDNKLFFKGWLHRIDLGDFAVQTFNSSDPPFPCILKVVGLFARKDHISSGKTVFLIRDKAQLQEVIKTHISQYNVHKSPRNLCQYFLEEPIPGSNEGTMYCSAYEGNLLSLRCMVRIKLGGSRTVFGVLDKSKFIIRSVPCGSTISSHALKIVKEAHYSGIFCINFKLKSNSSHPFYLENNPRLCGTNIRSPQLFLSNSIPLAFAIQKKRCLYNITKCTSWFKNMTGLLHWIVHLEKLVAHTGYSPINAVRVDGERGRGSVNHAIPPRVEFNISQYIPNDEFYASRDGSALSLHNLVILLKGH